MKREENSPIYKNPPSYYSNWNVFNDPSGQKQPGRYETDVLICENNRCPSAGKGISEQEAFYLFAKQPIWKRIGHAKKLYICPFCRGKDLRPLSENFNNSRV